MTDMDQRLAKVEGTLGEVVIILEGEPVLDIDGTKIGTTGGIVRQGERHAEALHVVDHKLDGLLTQLEPRRWTRNQLIKVSMVIVVFVVGMIPVLAWAF